MNRRQLFFSILAGASCLFAKDPVYVQEDKFERVRASVSQEVLIWRASETSADWAFTVNPSQTVFTNEPIEYSWDPGSRTAISLVFGDDLWDSLLSYTWFQQEFKTTVHGAPGIVEPLFIASANLSRIGLLSGPGGITVATRFEEAAIKAKIALNCIDWELGRLSFLGKSFSFRPFMGLKAAWIHQDVSAKWFGTTVVEMSENLKNHFFGIGSKMGVNTTWLMGKVGNCSFSLRGDVSGAFLWGHWTFQDIARNSLEQTNNTSIPPQNSGAVMTQSFAGMELTFNWNKADLVTQLGYEFQCWFDQWKLMGIFEGRFQDPLIFQGAVINMRVDF